jgi:hypothetical protein
MVATAWYMDPESTADQRAPQQKSPNAEVTLAQLADLGVLYWRMDASM